MRIEPPTIQVVPPRKALSAIELKNSVVESAFVFSNTGINQQWLVLSTLQAKSVMHAVAMQK